MTEATASQDSADTPEREAEVQAEPAPDGREDSQAALERAPRETPPESPPGLPPRLPAGLGRYVDLLLGLGGFVAGGSLASFLASSLLTGLPIAAYGLSAAGMIAAAVALSRFFKHPLSKLLTLALSTAGYVTLAIYLSEVFALDGLVAGLTGLTLALYFLYRDGLHRFITVLGTLSLIAVWTLDNDWLDPNGLHGLLLTVAVFSVLCFGLPAPRAARPAGFAAVVALLLLPLLILAPPGIAAIDWIPARAIAAVCGLLLLWLLRRAYAELEGLPLIAAALVILTAGALTTPGLGLALTVLVLGFWRGERLLTLLSLLVLPLYLFTFYYQLSITLLDKSLMLVVGGVLLLTLRQGLAVWHERQGGTETAGK